MLRTLAHLDLLIGVIDEVKYEPEYFWKPFDESFKLDFFKV